MKPLIPMTQPMNPGTAESFSDKREQTKRIMDKLEAFRDELQIAKMMQQESGDPNPPLIEASDEIIEYYNHGQARLKGFEMAGHFTMDGVHVCRTGQKDDMARRIQWEHTTEPGVVVKTRGR